MRAVIAILLLGWCATAVAQSPPDPEIGYIFPPSGRAGTTVEVRLGGVNWTPDMQYFVLDGRVKFEPYGSLGRLQLPEPPYFVGPKAYYPLPLARELSARVVISADMPSGPVRWQVANANGTSQTGIFFVGNGLEVVEQEDRADAQQLSTIPITISGRLRHNEEVDRYQFHSEKAGPVTCTLAARSLGSLFNGALEVRDSHGRVVAEEIDTRGSDLQITFAAAASEEYTLAVRDLDFRGHQSFVYRLSIDRAPAVLAAIPAAGRRGETRDVEFIGIGVKTGVAVLESVKHPVAVPPAIEGTSFDYQLETPFGTAAPVRLLLTDLPELIAKNDAHAVPADLTLPAAITGVLPEKKSVGRYRFSAKKGEIWNLDVQSASLGTSMDLFLSVTDSHGKELAASDDSAATTDPSLTFTAPENGTFNAIVGDNSSARHSPASVYRLVVHRAEADFRIDVPQRLSIPIGEKGELAIKLVRSGVFREPVKIAISGLPEGMTGPPELVVPADAVEVKIPLQVAANAASSASLVRIVGSANLGNREVTRVARAQAAGNLAASRGDENLVDQVLVAITMKPRTRIWPVESDERTVNRGSTHPAEIGIERYESFQGEIGMQMDSRQPHKFRQGLIGADIVVPAGRDRVLYPVYVPQMSETLDAYRLSLVAITKVPDPRGNVRYLLSRMQDTVSIGITVEGGLLKVTGPTEPIRVRPGESIDVPVVINSSPRLRSPARLELAAPPAIEQFVRAETAELPRGIEQTKFRIETTASDSLCGFHTLGIRAVVCEPGEVPQLDDKTGATPMDPALVAVLKSGSLPVIAETSVVIDFSN